MRCPNAASSSDTMKLLVICSVLLLAGTMMAYNLREEDLQYVKKLTHRCANKTGGNEEDITSFLNKDLPEKRTTKCLYACMSELFGIITREGKLDVQALKDIAKFMYADKPDVQKVLNEIADACVNTEHEDRCELAYKATHCAIDEATRRNINYKEFM
ncbi:general odorant-binding protein 19d-like [Phlebotomus argentipes]|uniref:general odorant-binding protein 19d-like n=1 Tax=Phlebotomus argentipes TaxID=94469 RepID=UPI002892C859|nr:general odorant-binding protein 19d-like [Phlebotomus argentipes]